MASLTEELRRASDAVVLTEPARMFHTDFGRLHRQHPRVVVRASQEDHIVGTLQTARRLGVPVAIRGAGHSCNGQTLTDGILLVNERDATAAPRMLDECLVEVPARMRWRDVEAFLNRRGRSVPVLADYLDLSVGGTLSVGCYGADSVTRGVQVDHVRRLRLILPDGSSQDCSPQENPELFSYALAGLGQIGVIETVQLDTVPLRSFSTLFTCRHKSLSDLVSSLEWLCDTDPASPLFFKALHSRGRFVSTYGLETGSLREAIAVKSDSPLTSGSSAHAWIAPRYRQWRSFVVKLWVGSFINHGRLWTDFLFDYQGLRSFSAFLESMLSRDPMRRCLRSIYILGVRNLPRQVPFPMEASDHLDTSMRFGIGLYHMIPGADPDLIDAVAADMRACLDECAVLGGQPYRYGWHQLTESDYRTFYGSSFDRLLELKRELDPYGIFQSALPGSRVAQG